MYEVSYFLTRNANSFPNKIALVFKDQTMSYQELNQRVNRLANHLLAMGVEKGDKVGYLFSNSIEVIEMWFATQKIGAVAVPINIHLLPREILWTVEFAECKILAYQQSYATSVQLAKEECRCVAQIICSGAHIPPGEYDFAKLCETGDEAEPSIEIKSEDLSIILFTSGTTGVSKGVVRTQRVICGYALMMMIENEGAHNDDILLTHCPFFHTAGLCLLMKMMALGGTFVIVDKIEPENILHMVERYQVTQILLVPPILYTRLIHVEGWRDYDLSSVKEAQFSGGICSMGFADLIFRLFPNCHIKVSYGSTETCAPTSALLTKEQIARHPARIQCIGRLNSLVEMRLCDDAGKEVPPGAVGEAVVRSPMVMKEYLKNPELTAITLVDGWVHTGDILKQDEDGYYYLMDRKKDMIKTGGENVYAQEVEHVLMEHPSIKTCAVVGVPDNRFGEAVAAVIVLNKNCALATEELIRFCKQRLPSYKKPRYIAFMDELPTNSMGKLQKNVLRKMGREDFQYIGKCEVQTKGDGVF